MVKYISFFFLTIPLLGGISRNQKDNFGDIGNYLNLKVDISRDTTNYNDTLLMTVCFTNKTDSCVLFYSKAFLAIEPSFDNQKYFLEYTPYILQGMNDTVYKDTSILNNLVTIEPSGIYSKTYLINVYDPYFHKGENKKKVSYQCHCLKKMEENNILCGILTSPDFEIYVKEK